jgi:hypothetical protein
MASSLVLSDSIDFPFDYSLIFNYTNGNENSTNKQILEHLNLYKTEYEIITGKNQNCKILSKTTINQNINIKRWLIRNHYKISFYVDRIPVFLNDIHTNNTISYIPLGEIKDEGYYPLNHLDFVIYFEKSEDLYKFNHISVQPY